jgi:1,4-dihydroxy-2-naphthoate octaprenyltransferase
MNSLPQLPMDPVEPHPARFAGRGWQVWIAARFWATRPMFFTASILPVVLGTVWGYRVGGTLDGLALLLALAGVICVHGAANVLNDVYDDAIGSDRDNRERIFPYTGGSRFIQNGVLTAEEMATWGRQLLLAGFGFGALLMVLHGLTVLMFGLIGLALAIAYSMPPLRLSDRGLGEIAVAIGFGVLPVVGSAWLQTGSFDAGAVLLSLPPSCWIANVLLINEIPDAAADRAAGRRNWVVRYGIDRAAWIYLALNVTAAVVAGGMVLCGMVNCWAALGPLLMLFLAIPAARSLQHQGSSQVKPVIQITLAIHSLGSLWLAGWLAATPLG